MLSLDDPRWKELMGGYRIAYDASAPLKRMEAGANVWEELWNELHHQGDVGEASYAALPHIVRIGQTWTTRDWNFYGLASIIETERHRKNNPPVPEWLRADYETGLNVLARLALQDLEISTDVSTIRCALSVVALWKGELKLGAMMAQFDTSEIDELAEERFSWSGLYG